MNASVAPVLSDLTDSELFCRYRDLDCQDSFSALYARYESRLISFLQRNSALCHSTAEDIAQQTWIEAEKSKHKFNSKKSFKSWFYCIAKKNRFKHFERERNYDASQIENAAKGFWETILATAGIPSKCLSGDAVICPKCNTGTLSGAADLAETGAVKCSACHDGQQPDGLSVVAWWKKCSPGRARDFVARQITISSSCSVDEIAEIEEPADKHADPIEIKALASELVDALNRLLATLPPPMHKAVSLVTDGIDIYPAAKEAGVHTMSLCRTLNELWPYVSRA